MSTARVTATPGEGWKLLVSNSATNIIVENATMFPFYLSFQPPGGGAPASDTDAYHIIYGREKIERETLNTDIYVRYSDDYDTETVAVILSQD